MGFAENLFFGIVAIPIGAVALGAGILVSPVYLLAKGCEAAYNAMFQKPAPRPNPNVTRLESQFSPKVREWQQVSSGGHPRSTAGPWARLENRSEHHIDIVTEEREKPFEITEASLLAIKKKLGFKADSVHIAVAGRSGVGKSSLINGFRGLIPKHPEAAPTGITECTREITPYPDSRYPWIVWVDIPGGGTTDCPDEDYFERLGLYVMDCIIVVWGDRFSKLDVAILEGAHRWGITTLIVRSKSDEHIRNLARAKCDDPDDEDEIKENLPETHAEYIEMSNKNLKEHLTNMGLGDVDHISANDCFLISSPKLRKLMVASQNIPEGKAIEKEATLGNLLDDVKQKINLRKRFQSVMEKHSQTLLRSPELIDEVKLVERVFSSVAETRYY